MRTLTEVKVSVCPTGTSVQSGRSARDSEFCFLPAHAAFHKLACLIYNDALECEHSSNKSRAVVVTLLPFTGSDLRATFLPLASLS